MSAGGRGRPPLRRKRTTLHNPVGDGVLDVPQIRTRTHGLTPVGADAPGGPSVRHSTMSAGGRGRPPLRRKRTALRPPVGDGVLDVPRIRTRTHGLTAVGADAPGGPFVQPSSMSAGGRGRPPLRRKRTASHHPVGDGVLDVPQIRTQTHGLTAVGAGVLDVPQIRTRPTASHHPVGEGLAPPAVYAPRPIFAPSRRGRRPRRPADPHPPHGFAPSRRGGACPSRGLRTTPYICTTPQGTASSASRLPSP